MSVAWRAFIELFMRHIKPALDAVIDASLRQAA
jgi:hypothetical protein